jgi:formate hydrogenlyase subunit 4
MGSAREATYACLAEPVLFFGLLVLAKVSGKMELAGMLDTSLSQHWGTAGAGMLLILASWFVLLLVENCRIPFDDPNTHLELTMIHEVMVLDHSGPALGMIVYAASLKLFVFAALVVRLSVPLGRSVGVLDWGVFVAGLLAVAVLVGVVESGMARLRLLFVPHLLIAACVLSALGLVLIVTHA